MDASAALSPHPLSVPCRCQCQVGHRDKTEVLKSPHMLCLQAALHPPGFGWAEEGTHMAFRSRAVLPCPAQPLPTAGSCSWGSRTWPCLPRPPAQLASPHGGDGDACRSLLCFELTCEGQGGEWEVGVWGRQLSGAVPRACCEHTSV